MIDDLLVSVHHQNLIGLGIAVAVGLLIGLEREQSRDEAARTRPAGMRTFTLLGLAGGLGGLLSVGLGAWAVGLVAVVSLGVLVGSSFIQRAGESETGMTTEMAAVVVHFLGVLATAPLPWVSAERRWTLVAAGAVVTFALLSTRRPLHRFADRVSTADLTATAKLGILLVIVLPLLPRDEVGPLPGVVPFEIGVLVSLIAAIGFVAYLGVRILGGQRGMVIAGGLGGLASSTAVTLAFARRVAQTPGLAPGAAAGITLAAAAMVPRQLIEVSVVAPGLLAHAAVPIGALGVTALVTAGGYYGWLRWRARTTPEDEESDALELENPSSLGQAIKFGLIFVVVMVLTKQAREWFGEAGLYVSAALGGLTDADATTLTVGKMAAAGQLEAGPATLALVLAAGANTLVKAAIAAALGGAAFGLRVLLLVAPAVVVGGVTAWVMY